MFAEPVMLLRFQGWDSKDGNTELFRVCGSVCLLLRLQDFAATPAPLPQPNISQQAVFRQWEVRRRDSLTLGSFAALLSLSFQHSVVKVATGIPEGRVEGEHMLSSQCVC